MDEVEHEYRYSPKWSVIFLGMIFFVFGSGTMAYEATTNDRGLIINGIITLRKDGATVFYWTLCFLSFCIVALSFALIFHRIRFRQRIAFTSTAIIVPQSRWSASEQSIPYRDIHNIAVSGVQKQRFLIIKHSGGRTTIAESMLSSTQIFEEVKNLLIRKI